MHNLAQPAFVLHSRAYRESSALVDLLTPQGRLRAVLRGARGKAGSLARAFVPLEIELRGRGELKTIGRLESAGIPLLLTGEALFSGLYLNELLIRLLLAGNGKIIACSNGIMKHCLFYIIFYSFDFCMFFRSSISRIFISFHTVKDYFFLNYMIFAFRLVFSGVYFFFPSLYWLLYIP